MQDLNIAVCQISPVIGDFDANIQQIKDAFTQSVKAGADIALFAECSVSAYCAKDLLLKPSFIDACHKAIEVLLSLTQDVDTALIIGTPVRNPKDKKPYNGVLVMYHGDIIATRYKYQMANESSCQDSRLFTPAKTLQEPFTFKGVRIGVPICDDVWHDSTCQYLIGKVDIILSLNASPYYVNKIARRTEIVGMRVADVAVPMVYTNDCAGYDSVLLDGNSFAINPNGEKFFQAPSFETGVFFIHFTHNGTTYIGTSDTHISNDAYLPALWKATTFGLKQYMHSTGFKSVVLGLSGGIDSAISCAIAVDALGAENVRTIMMPSPYTSQSSLVDAKACADALGVTYDIVPIDTLMNEYSTVLSNVLPDSHTDTTEENIQARIRGNIIMAVANTYNVLALTTGNKSEIAVGYCTLYGDMSGGFNAIKDIYKTDIFALATWRNTFGEGIPQNTIDKAPSAELRDNQRDDDTLPNYDILDGILKCLIERDLSIADTIAQGYNAETVKHIWTLLHASEHKRQQSATGLKLTCTDFANDRKYSISNMYTQYAIIESDKI